MRNCSIQNFCLQKNPLVEKSLDLKLNRTKIRSSIIWGCINSIILAVLVYDVKCKCSYAISNWYYCVYGGIAITLTNIITYFIKCIYYILSAQQLKGSIAQRNLLEFNDADRSFLVMKPEKPKELSTSPVSFNGTLLSTHSSFFNDSGRIITRVTPDRSSLNTSWNSSLDNSYLSASGKSHTNNTSKFLSPYSTYLQQNEAMVNEKQLENYLKKIPKQEKSNEIVGQNVFSPTSFNSFWFYCNSAAALLKTSLYQLSPSSTKTLTSQHNKDEINLNCEFDTNSELTRKIPSARLSKYVTNLRRWMAITILHRLDAKIKSTNESFLACGCSELQIGAVGLERLKKTVENQQYNDGNLIYLPMILPFLEISTNQEYLVQRIRVLAKGSCISNYQWNTEFSFQGLKWESNFPTDSSILFHLFCTYLDANLMPLPGRRPFYDRYVLTGDIKTIQESLKNNPIKNKTKCAILCSNTLDPKFNFITDCTIHKCAYDKKNIFHVLIQFLNYIKSNCNGVLEGINLGKSGVNILCIFD